MALMLTEQYQLQDDVYNPLFAQIQQLVGSRKYRNHIEQIRMKQDTYNKFTQELVKLMG